MKTEKPAAPEGCVYRPWFNHDTAIGSRKWLCYKKMSDGTVALCRYASVGSDQEWRWIVWSFEENPGITELLRLAALNARLVEAVEELQSAQNDFNSSIPEDTPALYDNDAEVSRLGKAGEAVRALIAEHRGEG